MVSSKLRGALLIAAMLLAVTAGADDAPPAAKPLDDATLASLGIDPGDVETNDGSWSWTSGAYSYDGSGNIKAIGTQTYAYDIRGRLVNATMTRPDQPGSQVHTYSYDAAGNMVSRTAVTTTPIPMPTSITTNHLTGLGAVYDEAGNVTELQPPRQSATYQYTFDALGALQRMQVYGTSTPRYNVYTADDERLWTYDGATNTSRWTIRDLAGKVLRDYTYDFVPTSTPGVSAPRWRLSRDYIYRDGLLLAAVTPTETLHFSLDHLGTPRVITNANRYKVGFHHYLPFGEEWLVNPQPTDTEPQKYTGHERDRDLAGGTASTDYMHARHYVGGVGRFLSIDPVLQVRRAMTSSQMWNRYSYAANNPLKYVDPTGKVVVLPADCDNARTTCRALSDLRNTVPVELRMFVRATTKDGQTTLDARYLNMMADASSKNFQRLRILGNSPGTVSVNTSVTRITYREGAAEVTEPLGLKSARGWVGITLLSRERTDGGTGTGIYVGGDLEPRLRAATLAHELVHALGIVLGVGGGHERLMDSNGRLREQDPNGIFNVLTESAAWETWLNTQQ